MDKDETYPESIIKQKQTGNKVNNKNRNKENRI